MKELNYLKRLGILIVFFFLLNDIDKAIWLLLQENLDILLVLGSFIHNCFEIRNNKAT